MGNYKIGQITLALLLIALGVALVFDQIGQNLHIPTYLRIIGSLGIMLLGIEFLISAIAGWLNRGGAVSVGSVILVLVLSLILIFAGRIAGTDASILRLFHINGLGGIFTERVSGINRSFDASGITEIRAYTPLGAIDVKPSRDGKIGVEADISVSSMAEDKKAVAEDALYTNAIGNLFEIKIDNLDSSVAGGNITIYVPDGVSLDVQLKLGNIDVDGAKLSKLYAYTDLGNIKIYGIGCETSAKSKLGRVSFEAADILSNPVTLSSDSGDVNITLLQAQSGRIELSTSVGSVDCPSNIAVSREKNGPKETVIIDNGAAPAIAGSTKLGKVRLTLK